MHGRGSEGETGKWSGQPVPLSLPQNMVYPALLPTIRADAHTSAASSQLNWRPPPIQMDSSVSPKEEIWFLCVCHHISIGLYQPVTFDLMLCLRVVSFRGQKRWRSLGAKHGEYGRWGSTSNFKSLICFTVWGALWGWALSCYRHMSQDNKPQCFLWIAGLSWFWSISLYPFTVHKH